MNALPYERALYDWAYKQVEGAGLPIDDYPVDVTFDAPFYALSEVTFDGVGIVKVRVRTNSGAWIDVQRPFVQLLEELIGD